MLEGKWLESCKEKRKNINVKNRWRDQGGDEEK